MKNVLVVIGHPKYEESFACKIIVGELRKYLGNTKVSILMREYPEYRFNARNEREKLINADIIVLHFPVYWNGMPALIKKWIEDIFVRGFAYGVTPAYLKGKKIIVSATAGKDKKCYEKDGNISKEMIFKPFREVANICKMKWQEPEFICEIDRAGKTFEEMEQMKMEVAHYTNKLIERIIILQKE